MLTDANGIPLGVAIAGANRNDCRLVEATLAHLPAGHLRPKPTAESPQGLCLDAAYDHDFVRALVAEFGFTAHIRSRAHEAQALKREAGFRARRWVVERTHSWINRFRRLLVRWDKKAVNYLAFVHLACACITYQQISLVG